jgi:acetyl-CoA synthetase
MSVDSFLAARDALLSWRGDPERAYREFRWPELQTFNWALDYFDLMAEGNMQPALIVVEEAKEERLSFAELAERSSQVANFLRRLGVTRGDRILLMLPNQIPLFELMLASIKLGAVIVPATTLLTPTDLRDRLERGAIHWVVTDAPNTEKFRGLEGFRGVVVGDRVPGWTEYADSASAPARFHPEGPTQASDPLLLYFTSGTTSRPKLVVHSHQSYPVGHLSTMFWLGLQPGDIHENISSPGWAKHAWSSFFAPWNAGATVLVHNYARFEASKSLEVLRRYRVNSLCAPPTVWRIFIQGELGPRPEALRELASAGEPLNPEVIAQVQKAWGLAIRDGYGQTETTAQIGNPPGLPIRPGSMGRPLPGYRVALLDPEGREAEEGEIALLLDPPPLGLMLGYLDQPERTKELTAGGYYRTGDVARRDAEGYFWYVGRADDVFKSSDYRISPFELESLLIEHPAVVEAAVIPSPHPVRGTVPKAYVILAAGYAPDRETARSIFQFIREKAAPYKRIRRLEFADLPKTISGKIRRVELRQRELSKEGRSELEFYEEDFEF